MECHRTFVATWSLSASPCLFTNRPRISSLLPLPYTCTRRTRRKDINRAHQLAANRPLLVRRRTCGLRCQTTTTINDHDHPHIFNNTLFDAHLGGVDERQARWLKLQERLLDVLLSVAVPVVPVRVSPRPDTHTDG